MGGRREGEWGWSGEGKWGIKASGKGGGKASGEEGGRPSGEGGGRRTRKHMYIDAQFARVHEGSQSPQTSNYASGQDVRELAREYFDHSAD